MTYRSKIRIVFIVVLMVSLDIGNYVADQQRQMAMEYEARISELEDRLQEETAGRAEDADSYAEKLREIIDELYGREMVAMGGVDTIESQNVDIMYAAIMNRSFDYRSVLSNLGNYFDARFDYLTTIPNVWPVEYNNLTTITSPFGYRLSPISNRIAFHSGVDIAGVWHAPISATADGVVVETWPAPDGYWKGDPEYGGLIKIRHAGGFETWYAHLSRVYVSSGDKVKQGDKIGLMGNTGQSRGQHLHYEVHLNGVPVNPLDYLRF